MKVIIKMQDGELYLVSAPDGVEIIVQDYDAPPDDIFSDDEFKEYELY